MDFDAYLDDLLERAAAAPGDGVLAGWATNLVVMRTVRSTNSVARRVVDEFVDEGMALPRAVLVAHEQTAGRGRHEARWVSPPGRGVYLSLIYPVSDTGSLPTLPLLTSVAVARALNRFLGEGRCRIKWPNDLLVDGRKIAGVLLAGVTGRRDEGGGGGAVLGVGVNHGQEADELEGLAPRGATSLLHELAGDGAPAPSLAELAWALVECLAEELTRAGDGAAAVERYRELSLHEVGERLRCRAADGTLEGLFRGFDGRGFLRLELTASAAGRRRGDEVLVTAGEVVSP